MDRMSELLPPAARRDRDEDGYPDASHSEAINVCQNCRAHVERLTLVPEFEYMGCDECMEEALAVIAREQAERKPVKVEPMQAVMFGSQEVA
jgi:hypothetical protein